MGNAKHRRRHVELTPAIVLPILQSRAEERGAEKGHVLGVWYYAKRRFGKGSLKTVCTICGMHVVAMPHGDAQAREKWIRENPGLLGDALVETCISTPTEQPVGMLGLRGIA